MKHLIFINLILLAPVILTAQWTQVAQIGNPNNPFAPEIAQDCYMISPTRGVTLLRIGTNSPHASWVQAWFTNNCWSVYSGVFNEQCQTGGGGGLTLQGLNFINDSVGFFIEVSYGECTSFRTFKTTNGGQSFSTFSLPTGLSAASVNFLDENNAYLMAFAGNMFRHFYLLRYHDGIYVTVQDYGTREYSPLGPYFINDSSGFVSYDGHFYRTSDYGQTWTEPAGVSGEVSMYCFPSESMGYIVQNNADFKKTTDGGINWVSLPTAPTTCKINSMFFFNESVGYATGNSGTILYTDNGGQSWDIQDCPTSANLVRIRFVTPEIGFIFAAGGALLKTTIVGNIEKKRPVNVMVYPNPTTGKFRISGMGNIENPQIALISAEGEILYRVAGKSDEYSVNLANGTYLIKITTEKEILYRKLILIKN
ncbi:MAG: YCF48-related protein [Bacteroidales bacterium]|jgi:hypothetical protein|nr:YCF48-related protein [Bacteroidales bacterium]